MGYPWPFEVRELRMTSNGFYAWKVINGAAMGAELDLIVQLFCIHFYFNNIPKPRISKTKNHD